MDEKFKESLVELLRAMGEKIFPVVRKGPGTEFRLSFTKNEARAEFFMGDNVVLQFTFKEDEIIKNEQNKNISSGKN